MISKSCFRNPDTGEVRQEGLFLSYDYCDLSRQTAFFIISRSAVCTSLGELLFFKPGLRLHWHALDNSARFFWIRDPGCWILEIIFLRFGRGSARWHQNLVVVVVMITFREIIPGTVNWSRKTPPAILHNLREKSGAKIKY